MPKIKINEEKIVKELIGYAIIFLNNISRGMMKMIIKLITIHVSDMEKSLKFYEGYLSLKVVDKVSIPGQDMVFLIDEEGSTIELIKNDENKTVRDEQGRVSFAMEVDDIHDTIERFKEKEIEIVLEPYSVPSGKVLAFVKDPDGIVVEFIEK